MTIEEQDSLIKGFFSIVFLVSIPFVSMMLIAFATSFLNQSTENPEPQRFNHEAYDNNAIIRQYE